MVGEFTLQERYIDQSRYYVASSIYREIKVSDWEYMHPYGWI